VGRELPKRVWKGQVPENYLWTRSFLEPGFQAGILKREEEDIGREIQHWVE